MQIVGIQIKETMNENSGNYKDVKSFFFWVCKESSVALIAGNWYSKLFLGSDICLTSSFIGLRSLTWRRSPTPVSMQEEEEGSLLKPLPSTQKNLGREAALKRGQTPLPPHWPSSSSPHHCRTLRRGWAIRKASLLLGGREKDSSPGLCWALRPQPPAQAWIAPLLRNELDRREMTSPPSWI